LVEDPTVWEEIKITDEQLGKVMRLKARINKSAREVRNNARSQFQGQGQGGTDPNGQQMSREERDAARQAERELRAKGEEQIKKDTDAELKKILSKPNQFTRVQQIDLQ